MSKKNKKKKFNSQKASESIRRKQELEQYGKLLSLRPSITHKDKLSILVNKNIKVI